MIFIYESKKGKVVPDPFQTDDELRLRQRLKVDLERIHTLKGIFKVTKGFVEKWTEWYVAQEDHPPFQDHRFSGYIERRPNHVMKLSMIVNASRTDQMIVTKQDLERAIAILEFTEKKMVNTFSGVGKAQNADVTTRVMQEIAIRKEMPMSTLLTMFYFDADRRTMEAVIETLRSMKFIKTSGAGKDQIIYYASDDETATQNLSTESLRNSPSNSGDAQS
jgi:hypothetical protein